MQRLCEYILFTGFGPFHRMYTLLQSTPSPDGYPWASGLPSPFLFLPAVVGTQNVYTAKVKDDDDVNRIKSQTPSCANIIYMLNCYCIMHVLTAILLFMLNGKARIPRRGLRTRDTVKTITTITTTLEQCWNFTRWWSLKADARARRIW